MTMIFVALIIVALLATILILRLRVRIEFSEDRRSLFVGLGRSGADVDLAAKSGRLNLFGLKVRSFALGKKKPTEPKKPAERIAKPKKPGRKRSIWDGLKILPGTAGALGGYFVGLLKAAVVEEAEGEIVAGFEQPDLTGMVFGYYQWALATAPQVFGRVRYDPVWEGAAFSGSVRLAVAIPMYRLAWRTVLLIFKLPLTKILKLAIGKKRGVQDG